MSERGGKEAVTQRGRRVMAALLVAVAVSGSMLAVGVPAAHADPDTEALCKSLTPKWTWDSGDLGYVSYNDPISVQTTWGEHWSVAAALGINAGETNAGENADIGLNPSPANVCNTLAFSAQADAKLVDWIAVDNRSGEGSYVATVSTAGQNVEWVGFQWVEHHKALTASNPGVQQSIGWGGLWLVDIRTMWLSADSTYIFTTTGYVSRLYLLSSDDDPTTWIQTSDSAVLIADDAADPGNIRSLTGGVHTKRMGYYGVLFVRDIQWYDDQPVTVSVREIPDCAPGYTTGCFYPKP